MTIFRHAVCLLLVSQGVLGLRVCGHRDRHVTFAQQNSGRAIDKTEAPIAIHNEKTRVELKPGTKLWLTDGHHFRATPAKVVTGDFDPISQTYPDKWVEILEQPSERHSRAKVRFLQGDDKNEYYVKLPKYQKKFWDRKFKEDPNDIASVQKHQHDSGSDTASESDGSGDESSWQLNRNDPLLQGSLDIGNEKANEKGY